MLDLPLQGFHLFSNFIEFLIVGLMMQDPLLEEGEKNQTNDHIEKEHQEQLKLPMRGIGEERPKSLLFHGSLFDGRDYAVYLISMRYTGLRRGR